METQNKLLINHVAKRLPYGLKVKTVDGVFDVCGWSDEIGILLDTILYGANAIPEYKLILFPLSSLTETITIKGESFVPIVELYKLSIDEDIEDYKIVTPIKNPIICGVRVLNFFGEYNILSFSESNGFCTQKCGEIDVINERKIDITSNQQLLFEKLLEWHFDVDNLIEQNLAISVLELTENPYA